MNLLKALVVGARTLKYRGSGVYCPCCERHFRQFRDVHRPNSMCPRCWSWERHRQVALWLTRKRPDILRGRVLHFAPEPSLSLVVRPRVQEYVTSDLMEAADVRADITALPFPDDRWDMILCSHVLEHVPDDRAAMSELRRVLAPGGYLIVGVPQNIDSARTDEDPTVTSTAERIRRFGQSDHVRLYGLDLQARLVDAGFAVQTLELGDFNDEEVEQCRLRHVASPWPEVTFVCH